MALELEPYIPRHGNKFGIVDQLLGTIRLLDIPPIQTLYCPFCGGGAFEYFMARRGVKVRASDIDADLIELHNLCRYNPRALELFGQEGYTKAEFKEAIKENSAHGAYVRSIWSFSNNGRDYLTAEANENIKLEEFARGEAEPNSRHKHLEDIALLWGRYPQMDLTFECKSYEDIKMERWDAVYADPPYRGTAKYQKDGFDHDRFYEWALSQPGLVLVSEYDMPKPFVCVGEYPKWVEYGRGARNKMAIERLYANRPVKSLCLF